MAGTSPLPDAGLLEQALEPLAVITRLASIHGDYFRYSTPVGRMVVVNDPETARRVLYSPEQFPRFNVLPIVFGDGLLATEGERWHGMRRRYQPHFHASTLEGYSRIMAREAGRLCDEWEGHARSGEPIEVLSEILDFSLRVSSEVFFGEPAGEGSGHVSQAVSQVIVFLGRLGSTRRNSFTPAGVREQRRALATLEGLFRFFIERRRASPPGDDVLWTLVSAKDEDGKPALTDDELRDEVATLMLGGHETTSMSLSWGLWELAHRPDAVAHARPEWAAIERDGAPTLAQVGEFTRTRALVQEIMRLRPPVWSLVRRVAQDTMIGPHEVEQGAHVMVSPYLLHRHPAHWEAPEEFRADRFEGDVLKQLPRGAYMPFGQGPHTCIGQHIAMLEAQVVLPTILSRFDLEPLGPHAARQEAVLTLRPGEPLLVRLHRRASASA